ncbi:MAG: histidine kinase, partial [Bacteroidota bacterium]
MTYQSPFTVVSTIRWLTVITILLLVMDISAQSAPQETRSKRTKETSLLEDALAFQKDRPQKSIRLLNRLIQREEDPTQLAAAFTLLGDIYVDIEEYQPAANRYRQALAIERGSTNTKRALLHAKVGNAEYRLRQFGNAKNSFNSCLTQVDSNSAIGLICQEGLADIAVEEGNYSLSQTYYPNIRRNAPNKPIIQSRAAAKESNVYIKLRDYENAQQSYEYAVEQLPKTDTLQLEDVKDVIAANRILNEKLETLPSDVSSSFKKVNEKEVDELPSPIVINDRLARFDKANAEKDPEAEALIDDAIERIDSSTSLVLSAELYRKGATYYLERNQPAKAAAAYQQFMAANDSLMAEQQRALDLRATVLKEQSDVDLGLKDITLAKRERSLLNEQIRLQWILIFALGALLLGALFSVLIILRNVRKRKRANQELMLRSLQSQMNPHFIFNSLNSINNFIARQDERSANRYLGRFAKLMRRVLDQSGKTFVPLEDEIEQLGLYLELEQQRFGDQFNYQLKNPVYQSALAQELEVPPMLLQPFVENAIGHGLRYRPQGGELLIDFIYGKQELSVIILDNGIGREKSKALKTNNQKKHRSTG